MRNFLGSMKCKVILFILALLLGIMIYAVSQGGYTINGIGILKGIAAPFQRASNAISQKVEYVLDLYTNAESYYEENQALKEEITSLYAELAEYQATKQELAELQEFVGIKEDHEDFTLTTPFEVIGYVTNDPYGSFIIDGGTRDGVDLYDPVATVEGLVGIITEVSEETATVTTILSPDVLISALCVTTGDKGVLTGNVSMLKDGCCKLSYLEETTELKINNVIVTSGENGYFPRGYLLGYVMETGVDDTGLTAYAKVKPSADFENLSKVVVITDFDGKEERDEAQY